MPFVLLRSWNEEMEKLFLQIPRFPMQENPRSTCRDLSRWAGSSLGIPPRPPESRRICWLWEPLLVPTQRREQKKTGQNSIRNPDPPNICEKSARQRRGLERNPSEQWQVRLRSQIPSIPPELSVQPWSSWLGSSLGMGCSNSKTSPKRFPKFPAGSEFVCLNGNSFTKHPSGRCLCSVSGKAGKIR